MRTQEVCFKRFKTEQALLKFYTNETSMQSFSFRIIIYLCGILAEIHYVTM